MAAVYGLFSVRPAEPFARSGTGDGTLDAEASKCHMIFAGMLLAANVVWEAGASVKP
jgi:hypothetical protein